MVSVLVGWTYSLALSSFSVTVSDTLIFMTCFLSLHYLLSKIRSSLHNGPNLPPGPRPWPLFGNLPDMGAKPHIALAKLSTQYGDILTVYLGPIRAVVLSDVEVIKHAMVRQADCFSDRQPPGFLEEAFHTKGSVLWENGEPWRRHRKMVHNAFRKLGFRQKQFHSAITSEMEALCAHLETKVRYPSDIRSLLTSATANVICTVCFGHGYEYDDPEFSNAIRSMLSISNTMSGISIAHVVPKLYHTPLYTALRRHMKTLQGFIEQNIRKHREEFDPGNIRDVVDVYLSFESSQQEHVVCRGLFDLFTAGSETTADSLLWAVLYMMLYPDIQKKVQHELDSVSEDEQLQYPGIITRLPYTYATLMEVHRHQSVAPLSLPRTTSRNTSLFGYDIPKGTSIWVNEWAIHNDPAFWGDPEVFRPSRFLDHDGKHILREKTLHLISFGYGLRQCLGKRLAEMENFMLFGGLFRRFTFSVPPGTHTPSTDGHFGLTYSPLPFQVKVERR